MNCAGFGMEGVVEGNDLVERGKKIEKQRWETGGFNKETKIILLSKSEPVPQPAPCQLLPFSHLPSSHSQCKQ